VALNQVAEEIIERQRSGHPEYVFTYRAHPIRTMNTTTWKLARKRLGLHVRIHDLRHTFGRRLRAAGVSFEDRQDLLGHKYGRVTTHYPVPELVSLITSANAVCGEQSRRRPALTILRRQNPLRLVAN
jgi:integrase